MSSGNDQPTSIPLLAVQECKSLKVTVETRDGQRFSGVLRGMNGENGNVTLEQVIVKQYNGQLAAAGRTVVRGSAIRLVELPRELKRAEFLRTFYTEHHTNAAREAKKEPAPAAKARFVKRGSDAAKAQKLLKGLRGKMK